MTTISAQVDMNIVKTSAGEYVEVQGTAEGLPFGRKGLNDLLDLADKGLDQLFKIQNAALSQV
jgi:ribonuclease PH